jgi:tryptophan 2,3-dioxygenase
VQVLSGRTAKRHRNDEKENQMQNLYYSEYIELDKILNSQHPKSFESIDEGNDEMLFIIIHQVYELWFKQIIFELDLVRNIFMRDGINDNSDDMSKVVQKLKRIGKILELINQHWTFWSSEMSCCQPLVFRASSSG